MADRVADWCALIESLYPPREAASWDSPGLQVGAPAAEVSRVLISLDVTSEVIDEAARAGASLLVAHHPLLMRPLQRLTPDTAAGGLALAAAQRGIAVYGLHTNFDVAVSGTTDPVTDLLGLDDARPLVPQADSAEQVCKLVTFVPQAHTEAVIAALSGAGAGSIGEYEGCTFRVAGTGTFTPSAAADPALGQRGQRNDVVEDRVETEVARGRLADVVAALWQAHPYEEVAYDVYELVDERPRRKGLGRVGELPQPATVRELADALARGLPAPHLRVAGDLDRVVRRVAACGGAGDSLIEAARQAGAELYITGDLRHHPALDALETGMSLIDAGHFAVEAAALPSLRRRLESAAVQRGLSATILGSEANTEPWAAYRPPGGP